MSRLSELDTIAVVALVLGLSYTVFAIAWKSGALDQMQLVRGILLTMCWVTVFAGLIFAIMALGVFVVQQDVLLTIKYVAVVVLAFPVSVLAERRYAELSQEDYCPQHEDELA
jgi:ABC-type uncharacterized transport system permease subunit